MIPIPFTVLWLIALIVFAVGEAITAVSYTHLTLPTTDVV